MEGKTNENIVISSIGYLLAEYEKDLKFINNYRRYRNDEIDEIDEKDYLKNNPEYFRLFIDSYRVTRNVKTHCVSDLLRELKEWPDDKCRDVDDFANKLREEGIIHANKLMVSLSSKLLFLRFPGKIIPIDTLNRKALGLLKNEYSEFSEVIEGFICNNQNDIDYYLCSIEKYP
ncbi:MAG: hypothetical protein K9G39_09270 [Chlorobium sp.]|uniref:hypothetical protein n=1 Tax=Chlorobium sp. TaxID=1095 RepID=UPI0025B8CBC7|nr:hypothetical protein [Chlorobium sp.]MCF8383760.1 hypothetical protein [Chlorobium sp.]